MVTNRPRRSNRVSHQQQDIQDQPRAKWTFWDESLRTVKAKSEQVWDEYIKAHPDAEAIRTNGCPYYKQLCVIFGNEIFYQEGLFFEAPNIDFGTPSLFVKDELEDENIPNERTKCQSVTPPTSGPRKRNTTGIEDIMARAISDIAAASKLRISAVAHSVERFSIANCVEALDEIQGVDDRIYYAALDLFDKPNARETFMSLKAEKRFVWLKRKCNAPSRSIA
ncbi:hypothetical protein IFM89_034055 [Coptis chinensis]|uniref:At2g29880-like C-terminal domain-containing protein n=1 Tax=Coptis chinensis TaxID=261450 RepID=A0A835IPP0_9MAGN|nr:hypothetical protein IFM89_034055 [Coptis chinensis]